MKRIINLVFVISLLTILMGGIVLAEDKRGITIGTAGTSGALYPMGVAMAQTINNHTENFMANAAASGASLENIRNLSQNRIDWGISQNEVAYFAYNGIDQYKGHQVEELRALFSTLVSWVQIFTSADSEIESVADFKDKRIGVGAPGSGGELASRKILKSYGLSYDDIQPEYISDTEMVNALRDGTIDAFIITHPLKSAALLDLTSSFDVKMIELADDKFYQDYPYYTMKEIPAGTYNNVDKPIRTATSAVVMYTTTTANFSEDEIYELLNVIWSHRDEWKDTHAAVNKYVTLETALDGISTPLHPGAVKYYQDNGFEIPENLIP